MLTFPATKCYFYYIYVITFYATKCYLKISWHKMLFKNYLPQNVIIIIYML